jgi:hypothetical protein
MSVSVTYNGQAPWVDDTPFVSIHKEPLIIGYAKAAEVHIITLEGTIIEDNLVHSLGGGTFAPGRVYGSTTSSSGYQTTMEDVKNDILATFQKNWKELEVWDSSGNLIISPTNNNGGNIMVESIDFAASKWIGAVNYTISLKAYPTNYFDDDGVVEKVDEYSITQNEDETYVITHRIQARGVNTDEFTDALTNANNFVNARRGILWNGSALPLSNPILQSETENINRLEGTYEVQETWVEDYYGIPQSVAGAGVHIRASVDVDESSFAKDFPSASITVVYSGGENTTYASLRNEVMTTEKLHEHCQEVFDSSGVQALDPIPLTGVSIDENMPEKQITQKATFDTNDLFSSTPNGGRVFFDYNSSWSYDNITGITKVTIEGNVITRGSANYREFSINDWLTGFTVPRGMAVYAINQYNNTGYKNPHNWAGGGAFFLRPSPESLNITKNPEKMTARISATYNDTDTLAHCDDASYDVTVNTPVYIRKANPSASYNGHYALSDFGIYSRQKHSARVNIIMSEWLKEPPSEDPNYNEIPGQGEYTNKQNFLRGQGWDMMMKIDDLFPECHILATNDAYIPDEKETFTSENKQTINVSRQRNYCTNNPVIGFPPDPMVGFGASWGPSWGLNNGLLPCPAPTVIGTTAPPTTPAPTTTGSPTTPPPGVTTIPPTTTPMPTTPPPANPICLRWGPIPVFSTGTSYPYGWRVCHNSKCYTCMNIVTTSDGTIPQPCDSGYTAPSLLPFGVPGASSQWSHECVDDTCPTNLNALDCCCSGAADCGCT